MQQLGRQRRRLLGTLPPAAIAGLVLVGVLSLGGCCWDCARLSRMGAAVASGPLGAPATDANTTRRPSLNAGSSGAPPDSAEIPAGGEPVGSGFYVNARGQLLTTWDEIRSCSRIAILDDYEMHDAVVVAANRINGLAVLRAATHAKGHAAFRSDPPLAGEKISVFAYPAANGLLLPLEATPGSVRAPTGPYGDEGFLQNSLPTGDRSAGGPIVDARGAVIGIVVSGSAKNWPAGVGYGIGNALILKYLPAIGVEIQTQDTGTTDSLAAPPGPASSPSDYTVPVLCFR